MTLLIQKKYWRRKEMAEFLEVTVGIVARNEVSLGLNKARSDINSRLIRYNVEIALEQLKLHGAMPRSHK